jgi:sulfur-oxidizing protein SoxZ
MAKVKPRVKVPKSAAKGEIIEIKTLISHTMESGQRKDKKTGEPIPRKIINKFECDFDGKPVFSSDWHPAISANPYMAFRFRADKSGTFAFKWTDDDGSVYAKEAKLKVE